jgi:hypothetical protein
MKRLLLMALAAVCFAAPASAGVIRNMNVFYQNGSYALQPSTFIGAAVLSANTDDPYAVPVDGNTGLKANYVQFSGSCNFYVNYDAVSAVPSGSDVTNGTSSELNPTVRYLGGNVTNVHLITAASGCVVTMQFYR